MLFFQIHLQCIWMELFWHFSDWKMEILIGIGAFQCIRIMHEFHIWWYTSEICSCPAKTNQQWSLHWFYLGFTRDLLSVRCCAWDSLLGLHGVRRKIYRVTNSSFISNDLRDEMTDPDQFVLSVCPMNMSLFDSSIGLNSMQIISMLNSKSNIIKRQYPFDGSTW